MPSNQFGPGFENPYQTTPVIEVQSDARAAFIRKTYLHLALALAAFAGLEVVIFTYFPGFVSTIFSMLGAGGRMGWIVMLGGFMFVSWIANKWAMSDTSRGMQYAGLLLYTFAEAILFIPLLGIVISQSDTSVLPTALLITGTLFSGLTFIVFTTRKDFSFLGGILKIGFFIAIGTVVAGAIFGFTIGLFFSFLMVALAGASILYSTSRVLHHYHTEQYVAASLALFASFALLLWYVLQIVLGFGRN